MTTAEQATETLAEKRRRLKAEREAQAATKADENGEQPADDFEEGPNQNPPTPEDATPEADTDPLENNDEPREAAEGDGVSLGPEGLSGLPINAGRTSAGADPQLQMDEVVLDAEDFLDLLANLETMERTHAAKFQFDKAHRQAWATFIDRLQKGDGKGRAYRLRDFRIFWPAATGDPKNIAFTRDPMQRVSVSRITDD